jgi:GNAT superfamily N-acetyltransferase
MIEIRAESPDWIAEYARVPISFEVRSVFDVERTAGGLELRERAVEPYVKDYDAEDGQAPHTWPARFDLSRWGFFAAFLDDVRVGGAAVAFDTPEVDLLEGRRDVAVLWDIRVSPAARGRDIGVQLFRAAEAWAVARGCQRLDVETQNVNVGACRFYAQQGCVLREARPFAYPSLPQEIQLLWSKELPRGDVR